LKGVINLSTAARVISIKKASVLHEKEGGGHELGKRVGLFLRESVKGTVIIIAGLLRPTCCLLWIV